MVHQRGASCWRTQDKQPTYDLTDRNGGDAGPKVRAAALALLAVAILAANTARGDLISFGDIVWPGGFPHRQHQQDHIARDDARIDEVFPIKHQCSEVPVLIHAQRRTVERMVESCNALKWADDRFHALMQTNPGDAVARANVYGHLTTAMEMFVLDLDDPEHENYLQEFWSTDRAGVYLDGVSLVGQREGMGERERENNHILFLSVEVHEYVHHLQLTVLPVLNFESFLAIWLEGFASYIQNEYELAVFRPGWYGPLGSFDHLEWEYIEEALVRRSVRLNGLPPLTAFLDWQDIRAELSGYTPTQIIYYWGAWLFRFLVEVHPQELVRLKEVLEGGREVDAYDLMTRLNDDWYDWDETLATLSVVDAPEPIVVRRGGGVEIYLDQLFRTINELTFEVSAIARLSTNDNPWYDDTPPNVHVNEKRARIIPNSLGTWMFTITATNIDGESAELPFTVTVERGLELTHLIVIRDSLSTAEGRTVVNLNHYFDSVESIAFTAESTNAEVATVEVTMEGRLIVTAISPGSAEITVRATSSDLRREHTFAITVTDECPPWLCKDVLSGWRKALLL